MYSNKQIFLSSNHIHKKDQIGISLVETSIPDLKDGELLVRNIYLAFDPRNMIGRCHCPKIMKPGAFQKPMNGQALGIVERSKHPAYKPGDAVTGPLHMQTHAVSHGTCVSPAMPHLAPHSAWLGALGLPGLTAYCGLMQADAPVQGQTVLISGATTRTGSLVGQIAKLFGCRIVGIVDGESNLQRARTTLGFDAAVDVSDSAFSARLGEACAGDIDLYFDTLGCPLLDEIVEHMAPYGKIVLADTAQNCGLESIGSIMAKGLQFQSVILASQLARLPETVGQFLKWHHSGKFAFRDAVRKVDFPSIVPILTDMMANDRFEETLFELA